MTQLEYSTYNLQSDFNKLYTDVLNCEIVAPPYYNGTVPHAFFLKTRHWFKRHYPDSAFNSDIFDVIFDIERVNDDNVFILGKKDNKIKVINFIASTQSLRVVREGQPYVEGTNYKFLYINAVKGKKEDQVDQVSGETGLFLIKNWGSLPGTTVDKAGKYLYLNSAGTQANEIGTGIGQVFKIDYVQSGKYNIASSGWVTQPKNLKWFIYPLFWKTLAFIDTDSICIIHDFEEFPTTFDVTSVPGILLPMDAIFVNNRLYVLQRPVKAGNASSNVFAWGYWYNTSYFGLNSMIGSVVSAYNISAFQSYVLIFHKEWIDCVLKVTTTINSIQYNLDVLSPLTKDVSINWQNQFVIYNEWLYIISDDKKFYSVSITPQPSDKYSIKVESQGVYIQRFLDEIKPNDLVRIWMDNQDIYLLHYIDSTKVSRIFIYNGQYSGWLHWETKLQIRGFKSWVFFGKFIYEISKDSYQDIDLDYPSKITITSGEDNIYQHKILKFLKLLVWNKMDSSTKVRLKTSAGGYLDTTEMSMQNAKYFEALLDWPSRIDYQL